MSLYAEYLFERTNDEIIETADGFVTYRYLNDDQVYIIDIFIRSTERKKGKASELADIVRDEARLRGCKEMLGTVVPNTKNATASIITLIAYGMKIHSSSENLIVFKKDI